MEGVLEVNPERLETLFIQDMELPYVEFGRVEPVLKLLFGGEEYWYYRTLPLKGYGGALARYVRELAAEGKKLLLARYPPGENFRTSQHWDRLYIYATGVTPIGAGKSAGHAET